MKKISFSWRSVVAAAALVAGVTFTSSTQAATDCTVEGADCTPMFQLPKDFPQIVFDGTGRTTYSKALKHLRVDASAIGIQYFEAVVGEFPEVWFIEAIGNSPPPFGAFAIRAQVDNDGVLIGGIPPGDTIDACGDPIPSPNGSSPADFCVRGRETLFGISGTLLRGEVVAFRPRDGANGEHDLFEFHIRITGGELATMYNPGYLVVPVDSEADAPPFEFEGSFNKDFAGHAMGTAASTDALPAPLPPPLTTCQDSGANNYGLPLPCTYDPLPPVCPPDCPPDDTPAPPPTVTGADGIVDGATVTLEATGPSGAPFSFGVTGTSEGLPSPVVCSAESGSVFALGTTQVMCMTAIPDRLDRTGRLAFVVTVHDTTPPTIIGSDVEVEADGQYGHSSVLLPVTATDLVDGAVNVVCDPASGSAFPLLTTSVTCSATDAAGNLATRIDVGATELADHITVTVKANAPPLPDGEGCFVVDFREVTYFKGKAVITSWPYNAAGGVGKTKSRGTLYRIYGFQRSAVGQSVPNADNTWITYEVKEDASLLGSYYIDLGGPARVMICAGQLHEYVLTGKKGNGHMEGSTLLPVSQQNVPGIMLTHNTQIVKVPYRVRWAQYQQGLYSGDRGVINYIGFQLQGNGNSEFREFVDVEVQFPGGFRTAINTNFETFAGCSYLDYTPGNDAVRLHDVWGPNRSKNQGYNSALACGTREPAENQQRLNAATGLLERRANYNVPLNGVQILSTVNTNTDTLRLFYGAITKILEKEMKKKDLKDDWREWDIWDR